MNRFLTMELAYVPDAKFVVIPDEGLKSQRLIDLYLKEEYDTMNIEDHSR